MAGDLMVAKFHRLSKGITSPRFANGALVLSLLMAIASLVTVGVLGFSVIKSNQNAAPWEPLGPYPVQTVKGTTTYRIEGGDNRIIPAIYLDDPSVIVTGTKCASETVNVRGSISWQSSQPPGLLVIVGSGVGLRQKGCVESKYENNLPLIVHNWAENQFANGQKFVIVSIVGTETANREGRADSEQTSWRTEEFVILPPREST